jgi:hypothetical protein
MMNIFKTLSASAVFSLGTLLASSAYAQHASPPVATSSGVATAASVGAAAPPRCDSNCVRSNALQATEACVPRIAAQSPSDFDWNSRPAQGIFKAGDPSSPADAVVHYVGDTVRFVNSQKAWVRVSYECAYDVEARTVVAVNVRSGKLDQAPASAAVPPNAANAVPVPNNTNAAAPTPPQLSSQALAQAIQQAARPKPRVWEPSRVEIQQQPANPRR